VIDPLAFMVEIYARSRKWEVVVLKRADDVIEMPEVGLRCRLADLYRSTETGSGMGRVGAPDRSPAGSCRTAPLR
jgi:hypothetical protein